MEPHVPNRGTIVLVPKLRRFPPLSCAMSVIKIKTNYSCKDLEGVLIQIRAKVKDSAKKFQAINDHYHGKLADNTGAEMASTVISLFEHPTSLCCI